MLVSPGLGYSESMIRTGSGSVGSFPMVAGLREEERWVVGGGGWGESLGRRAGERAQRKGGDCIGRETLSLGDLLLLWQAQGSRLRPGVGGVVLSPHPSSCLLQT